MAYIGKSPVIGNFVKLDAITAVNGQAAYTMNNGGSAFTDYESVNQFLVSLNGTIQAPTDSFTVSGSTLTFASNLSTGDVIDFIMVFGNSLSAGTPTDATVSTAKIVDDAVTAAKINNDIISGSTELASEPADTDEFLVSDAGTLKRIDYSLIKGGGITMVDQWRITSSFTGSVNPLSSNWERNDKAPSVGYYGSQMTESSGLFTFPSTGIYYVSFTANFKRNGDSRYNSVYIRATTDGSTTAQVAEANQAITQSESHTTYAYASAEIVLDIQSTSNNKVAFEIDPSQSSTEILANTNRDVTYARFIRLGDT